MPDPDTEEMLDTLPPFEGERVQVHRYKLAGTSNLPGEHVAATIDDRVTLTIEGVVVRVDHIVDKRTGRVKRLETIDIERIVNIGIASARSSWTYPEKEDT